MFWDASREHWGAKDRRTAKVNPPFGKHSGKSLRGLYKDRISFLESIKDLCLVISQILALSFQRIFCNNSTHSPPSHFKIPVLHEHGYSAWEAEITWFLSEPSSPDSLCSLPDALKAEIHTDPLLWKGRAGSQPQAECKSIGAPSRNCAFWNKAHRCCD